jgi:uncharacterized membrane protein YozB (DUF420 family)
VILALMIPVWARYGRLNPSAGRVSPKQHPLYFPVLALHILGASMAIVTCVIQVWPGLRRKHARVHRYSGRVYVCGVMLAGVTMLVLVTAWPYSAVTTFGQVMVDLLWVGVTGYGWVLIRRRRIADHRRWMLRSFAVTTSVLLNELLQPPIQMLLQTQLHTRMLGSQDVLSQMSNAIDNWVGFTIAFVAVEWYLERELLRRSAGSRRAVAARTIAAEDPVTTVKASS